MTMSGAVPTAREGRVQVTVPVVALQLHPLPPALTSDTPVGRVSVTVISEAVLGPALLTLSV